MMTRRGFFRGAAALPLLAVGGAGAANAAPEPTLKMTGSPAIPPNPSDEWAKVVTAQIRRTAELNAKLFVEASTSKVVADMLKKADRTYHLLEVVRLYGLSARDFLGPFGELPTVHGGWKRGHGPIKPVREVFPTG